MKKHNRREWFVILTNCETSYYPFMKKVDGKEEKFLAITYNPQNETILYSSRNICDCKEFFDSYK